MFFKHNAKTNKKNYIVVFKNFTDLADKYAVVQALNETQAKSIARLKFGKYVSAIYEYNDNAEAVLKWNFNKTKI